MDLLQGARLHQWSKNLLVFAPGLLGGKLDEPGPLLASIAAFLALGLVASATYLINDILDAEYDRRHWSKRNRPIAAGRMSPRVAGAWAAVGIAAGLAICAFVDWAALAATLVYLVLTFSYSLRLKRLPIIDALVLATLYSMRLALGVAASGAPPSEWLFVFSMFLFTSFSLAKRYTEIVRSEGDSVSGRGYCAKDAPLVLALGVAAGTGAVLIMVLYIIEDAFLQTFYHRSAWLWGFPVIVSLMVGRIWLITGRGEMKDDPVEFLLRDRTSVVLVAGLLLCFGLARFS